LTFRSPYMYHHYIEALFVGGRPAQAWEQLRAYWGEMLRDGADTFWEGSCTIRATRNFRGTAPT
ncbi:hypothetical protein ABTC38_18080, partial [Acinetobacter baumannii]